MTRSVMYLAIAAMLSHGPGSCSKSASDSSATPAHGSSGGNWPSLGATACAKYFTPDVAGALLSNPPGSPKTLSPQSCSLHTEGGNISVTLLSDGAKGFDAFTQNLVNPQPLAGVGDKAVQHAIGIAAFKAPSMVCQIDAVGAPGFLKLSGADLAKSLGGVCNQLFAATP